MRRTLHLAFEVLDEVELGILAVGQCEGRSSLELGGHTLPTFTNADLGSPERREAHGFAQLGAQFYLVGGRSDCGLLADVWTFDPALGTWKELKPPFTGTSCARSGKLNCTTLCF